jgi:hypothetical protein
MSGEPHIFPNNARNSCRCRISPAVVVPTCSTEWISRCLDSGAQTIIVPHVNTVEQARVCVDAAKFPPLVFLHQCLNDIAVSDLQACIGPPFSNNGISNDPVRNETLLLFNIYSGQRCRAHHADDRDHRRCRERREDRCGAGDRCSVYRLRGSDHGVTISHV